jgi:HEAT repeat protein
MGSRLARKIRLMESRKDIDGLIRVIKENKDEKILDEAAISLGNMEEKAVLPIIDAIISMEKEFHENRKDVKDTWRRMSKTSTFHKQRDALYNSFGYMQIRTRGYILELLNHKDPKIRAKACMALEAVKFKGPVGPLIDALKDNDRSVRAAAAYAMTEIKNQNLTESLLGALRDEYGLVRENAAYALKHYRNEKVLESLIKMTKDTDKGARWGAAVALGGYKDKRAIKSLVWLLDDYDYMIREEAVRSLGKIGDPHSFMILEKHIRDREYNVRKAVLEALGKIDRKKARRLYNANVKREIDHNPFKEERRQVYGFYLTGSFIFPLFMLLFSRAQDFSFIDFNYDNSIVLFVAEFMFYYVVFVILVIIIYFGGMLSMRKDVKINYYGMEIDAEKYYTILKKKIPKKFRIQDNIVQWVIIAVPNEANVFRAVTISVAEHQKKGDTTISVAGFKDVDRDRGEEIIKIIDDAMVEYALTKIE